MAKKRSPFSPEQLLGPTPEPEGLLSKAKSVGLSGLAYAGNLLGTPGAMVKNALAGENPLTPLLHPLSGEGRVEGRDLLRKHGLVGNENNWGNFAAGLATDIALDPLLYVNPLGAATKLGVLTKAGKVANMSGALDDVTRAATSAGRAAGTLGATQTMGRAASRARTTLDDLLKYGDEATQATRRTAAQEAAAKTGENFDDLLKQPLGGVANVWVPGFGTHTLGASERGAQFMEGVGQAASAIPGFNAASSAAGAAKRVVKGLFHGRSMGRFDKAGQELGELASEHLGPAKRETVQLTQGLWERFRQVDEAFHQAFKLPEETGGQAAKKYPLAMNDLVKAADRGNYGYVQELADDGAQVHFTNPETGATAVVKMPYEHLTRASSTELPESLRAIHDPVSRVLDRIVRMTAETKGGVDAAIEKFAAGQNVPQSLKDDIVKLAQDAVEAKDAAWKTRMEMGGKGGAIGMEEFPTEMVEPPIGAGENRTPFQHFPGFASKRKTGPLQEFRVLPTGHDSAQGRNPLLRYLRRDQVNDLAKSPKYRSADAASQIFKDMKGNLGYYDQEGHLIDPAVHARELADYVKGLPEDFARKGKNIFDNLSFQDLGHYVLQAKKSNASLQAIHKAFQMNLAEEGVPLANAFQHAGLDTEKAMQFFAKQAGLSAEQLATAKVPAELANAAKMVLQSYDNPEWQNLITKTLDTVNRYFKPAMVLVKPAFWFRNHTSGQYANLVSGYIENLDDVKNYWQAYKDVHGLWKANDQEFKRELEALGVMGIDSTLEAHGHVMGGMGSAPHSPLPPNPLKFGETAKETAASVAEAGGPLQGVRKATGTWMETNAKFNRVVEYQNRGAIYKFLKDKGYTPEQAAKIATEIHYDYSTAAMSPFEREVLRRVVPFYVFSRNNMPWTIERLLTSPGGGLGQTIQGLARAHKTEDLSPDYLSETASIPVGDLPDGSRRYVTGLGLGFEDPASFFTPSLKQVGLEALSRTSPVIKGPLEYAFGQSAFQKGPFGGRALEDLDPALGRTLANLGQITGLRNKEGPVRLPGGDLLEHALSNSPLSGVLTSARTLTDPRKGIGAKSTNLLTGLRLTDVSPAAMDRELIRRAGQVEKKLLGARSYTDTYIPKDKQAEFSPKEKELAEELKVLRKLLEKRREARK